MWIFPLFGIAFITVMVILVCHIFSRQRKNGIYFTPQKHTSGGFGDDASSESAMEILDKRYAKGEIGKEEYKAIKSDILDRRP